jgi:hypothetical protein
MPGALDPVAGFGGLHGVAQQDGAGFWSHGAACSSQSRSGMQSPSRKARAVPARGVEGVVAADGDGGAGMTRHSSKPAARAAPTVPSRLPPSTRMVSRRQPAGRCSLSSAAFRSGQVALLVEGDDHDGQDVLDGIVHGFLGNLVGGPLGLGGHAQQDLDILFGQRAAGEDAADAEHHVVGGVVGHEADVEQGPAPLGEHGLAHGGRAFGGPLLRGLEDAGGDNSS